MTIHWNWLAAIPMVLFLTACGGGKHGDDSEPRTASGIIPDTGQTSCYYDYTNDGFYIPTESTYCPDPGSGWSPDGQDGYYTINAMSFTDNGNGTVLDNVTGLTWQKCSLGQSGNNCATGALASHGWSEARNGCAQLGTGWRLPTIFELTQIADFSQSMGSINETAFPNTGLSSYWTSSIHPVDPDFAWLVDFVDANTWIDYRSEPHYARCVRG